MDGLDSDGLFWWMNEIEERKKKNAWESRQLM